MDINFSAIIEQLKLIIASVVEKVYGVIKYLSGKDEWQLPQKEDESTTA